MPPPGAHLSVDELLTALKWKLDNENEVVEIEGPTDSPSANWPSTWLRRMGELRYIVGLVAYHQNSFIKVNLLPAEILSEVFLQVQGEYLNPSFCLPPENPDLTGANEWIKVGHVCRKWWRTAQNTKELWSRIVLSHRLPSPATMATHFFHQSHPLPISLEQDIDTISDAEDTAMHKFYNLLLEHPNRVSALYLRGYFPEKDWHLLQKSLPNLVELELSFEKHRIQNGYIANFLGGFPSSSLRKLSLENYTWPGLTPPALTHLYLADNSIISEVGIADFFNMLALISPTLQALYLQGAGPNVFIPEEYDSLSMTEKLFMPVLEHFEVLSCRSHNYGNLLLHLYKLSLPNIHAIIWDSRWTADLRKDTDALEREAMIPPYEHLARVTRLVGWAARRKCYTLQEGTLYFDPSEVTADSLETWVSLLPNLVMLASPASVPCMNPAIQHSTTLTHLSFGDHSNYSVLVYTLEEASNTDCLPRLEVLTIYYRSTLGFFLNQVKQNFVSMKIKPLREPLINNSTMRARCHLQTTYTLRFDITARGAFLSDPSL